ncbi:MAG: universal stress protein [Rubrobacteraceae bacterium]
METFPDRILLADDGSRQAEYAAKLAAGLSNALGSEVHAVRAVEGSSELYMPPGWAGLGLQTRDDVFEQAGREAFEAAKREARQELEDTMQEIERAGGKVAEVHVRTGRPDSEIVELAEETGAGLVAIGSRGLGPLKRALLGSVSTSVVRHAHCPVLVTRCEGEGAALPERMLVAADGSGSGERALEMAAEVARAAGSELHLLHVVQLPSPGPEGWAVPIAYMPEAGELVTRNIEELERNARDFVEQRADRIRDDGGPVLEGHVAFGLPSQEILRLAEELGAGLVFTGSRGLGGVRRALLGSVSDSIVHHAHCSVMVVRGG